MLKREKNGSIVSLLYGSQNFVPQPVSSWIEMVEEFDGYQQIVLVLEGDFRVSLFVK